MIFRFNDYALNLAKIPTYNLSNSNKTEIRPVNSTFFTI
jgi:hypothetical protein